MKELLLATPALWYPGQSETEWQEEVDAMVERTYITAAFMRGEVYVDSFLDYLAETYADPLEVADSWDEELCLISI
ncbi:hypothetical protein C7B65_06515 [Phormidesmis priestleyi ULC007]|uniref:Uncharacterized protein n=1 Tax=Phormidesmis priestleyi ULC007 TaxID=1920490 RepID=A0A2T1DJE8_9CYAN|nr:hypothetical protein [Phormidesmis priestleyi]PSB20554.1 hypothetical protein C7B65_06515 [Phormidesmis priestleyi ULC007]PZO54224.1 MAG: hypothetical protein DCF14_02160 [Phormidesmis priestleyi]